MNARLTILKHQNYNLAFLIWFHPDLCCAKTILVDHGRFFSIYAMGELHVRDSCGNLKPRNFWLLNECRSKLPYMNFDLMDPAKISYALSDCVIVWFE